jgi:tetratricopeptide (TPR) repeat protein
MTAQLDKALAAHRTGNIDEATKLYRAVLNETPEQPDALHMLGVIAQQKGNPDLGLKLIEAALAKKPDMAMAWSNRALVLRVLGRREEALESARQAIKVDERTAKAWDLSGTFLREMGKDKEACEAHARAVELQPNNPDFRSNYATALLAAGDIAAAYKVAKSIERLDVKHPLVVLGNALKAAGYPECAIPYFQKARALLPQMPDILLNEAMATLLIGDIEKGWQLWRQRPDLAANATSIPAWQGEDAEHLLLYEEQGMGDAIQFARYIPLIKKRAKRMTLQITPPLASIFAASFPEVTVLTPDQMPAPANAQIRLTDLPVICKTTLTSIPAEMPYLRIDEKARDPWHERLAALPRPRIGLVWGGNPAHLNNRNRSLSFGQLAPLLEIGRGHFVSLQKGMQKAEANLTAAGIFDADPYLDNFSATAGLLKDLDLLITVDTSSAHLAGALGVPVWMLLPFDPDWRWLLEREDTPWYPTMRLFREQSPRNWHAAIAVMRDELKKFLAGDKDVLKPVKWTKPPARQNPRALDLKD